MKDNLARIIGEKRFIRMSVDLAIKDIEQEMWTYKNHLTLPGDNETQRYNRDKVYELEEEKKKIRSRYYESKHNTNTDV